MNISIAMRDTKQKLVSVINESNLPMCILKEMLQNIYMEVSDKAEVEYKKAVSEIENKQEVKDTE